MIYFDPNEHPTDEKIAEYLDHLTTPEERGRLEEHFSGCRACCQIVADALRAARDQEE